MNSKMNAILCILAVLAACQALPEQTRRRKCSA